MIKYIFLFALFLYAFVCYGQDTSGYTVRGNLSGNKNVQKFIGGDLIKPDIPFPDTLIEKTMAAWIKLHVIVKNPGIIDTCLVSMITVWPKGMEKKTGLPIYSNFYPNNMMRSTPLGDSIAQSITPWLTQYTKGMKFIPDPDHFTMKSDDDWFSLGVDFEIHFDRIFGKKGRK